MWVRSHGAYGAMVDRIASRVPTSSDLIAGASVALILIPQSLAYAELAGLPPYLGLYAAAFPLLAFALLASSPFLQTGPVAVTSLLTISALPDVAPEQLPGLAALMAVLVGLCRIILGVARLGRLVRLMSAPVVMGFTSGAAFVIVCSQLPKAIGSDAPDGSVLWRAGWAVTHFGSVELAAVMLSIATLVLFLGGRRLHALFPGVLVAVIVAIVWSQAIDYSGAIVGDVPEGLPPISIDLPWGQIPTVLLGAVVIALVGFAEPASIARTFADETGQRWEANRELFASGVANLVAAFSGGYPVGGSFSRSSVNRIAGAETTMSGGVTGLVVIAFLPFASVLEPLPTAVLGAIVCGAAAKLIKPIRLVRLWNRSRTQALLAWGTAAAVLVFAPRIERAVIVGVALTLMVHLAQRFGLSVDSSRNGVTTVEVKGLLWTGTAARFDDLLMREAMQSPGRVVVDFKGTSFVDDEIVDAMAKSADILRDRDLSLSWCNEPDGSHTLLSKLVDPRNANG